MNCNVKWWFSPAHHGEIKGENTGDKEIFKKDTYVSLAREILQNSIDARQSDEEPVIVKFKEFKMKVSDIPGIEDYKAQINRCIYFWDSNKDFKEKYRKIYDMLNKNEELDCLKISDYNTSGLNGIKSTDSTADNAYNALVKGTGVSKKKNDYAGGSKGVGKNVPFLLSKLMMVFYETHTTEDEIGSVGVTKLASGYIDDNFDELDRDYTQGTGYYAYSNLVSPIDKLIEFDGSSNERINRYGTDIYIIGFEKTNNWINEVINSTLESFMASIVMNSLNVTFNDISINSDSLENIIDSNIIDSKFKKGIVAQYKILKKEKDNVKVFDLETELGNATMYILTYKKEEEDQATKSCAMIRTPMMLIKNINVNFPVSAMVIIGIGKLGKELRAIENAQHNDWETKRIKDASQRRIIENAIIELKQQINDNVLECLKLGEDAPIDPLGAGEFLSSIDDGTANDGSGNDKKIASDETATVGTIRKINQTRKDANIYDKDGDGVEPQIGDIDNTEEGEENSPLGNNQSSGGEPRNGDNPGEKVSGDNEIIVKAQLTGVKYKVISTDKKLGKMKIIFNSPESYEKCYLNINLLDDANQATRLDILSLEVNGKEIEILDIKEPGPFELIRNNKTIINVKVNKDDYFASEIKVKYENRL